MPVTVIDQRTTSTKLTNWILWIVTRLTRSSIQPSPGPYPHNALDSKPGNFEQAYNATVIRMPINDLPNEWKDREHWPPLLIRPNTGTRRKRMLLYWHGGAFVNMCTPFHWRMLGKMAHELDADVALQTYTMVPHAGIHNIIDKLVALYMKVRDSAKQNGQELLIAGDSAGGNLVAVMLLALNDRGLPLPDQAIMIAPGFAVHIDSPENRAVEKVDPMLIIDKLSFVTRAWAIGPVEDRDKMYHPAPPATPNEIEKMRHPYASPIYGDWKFLAKNKVPITITQGTHDLLLPQVEQFVETSKELDLELTYIRAEGACHVHPLLAEIWGASVLAPDSIEGLRLLIESVKRYSEF